MPGEPVSGADFFNRKNELGLLARRLDTFIKEGQRRNIALIGLRKIGKSSLIDEFIKRNKTNDKCLFVSIYLPESSGDDFIFRAIGRLMVIALQGNKEQISPTIDAEHAVTLLNRYYPQTAIFAMSLIRRLSEVGKLSFEDLLLFFDTFQNESKLLLIIIFDEFQRLCDYHFNSPIDTFREFIMRKKNIWFIVAGSSVGMLNKLIASSESSLFGHFEPLHITGFDYECSKEFIEAKLCPYSLPKLNMTFLFDITNGNPYYLDIITFRIKDIMKEQNFQTISNDVLFKALTFEMFGASGAIYFALSSLLEVSLEKKGFGSYIDILKSIAKEASRLSEIAEATGIPLSSMPRYIKNLIELDIIGKRVYEDGKYIGYYFIDPTLELWLREVYVLREDSLIPSLEIKKKEFENRMGQIFADFEAKIGIGNEARVRELFSLFNGSDKMHNEQIPKFDSVENYNKDGDEIDIIAKSSSGNLVADVTDKNINITDIKEFIKKLERTGFSQYNKIFIALSGIDSKVIGFCKENKISLWNKEAINILMKKYGRKRI